MFQTGDIVKIKPEWGGDDSNYVVVEWNGDRGFITPQASSLRWPPRELVREYMIEAS